MALSPARPAHLSVWNAARRGGLLPALVLVVVSGASLTLRLVSIDQQSAYMDEATFILTGRILIEKHSVYAGALTWTYGSYLWSLIAGVADRSGGLTLVRLITAGLGTLMAVATALATVRLTTASAAGGTFRWLAALAAGLTMGVLPTAVAVGRFGTYDALAGAMFMLGIDLLLWAPGGRRQALPVAAMLLFGAFLAKYLVAVYFPVVCIGLLLADRRRCAVREHLTWFVVPLSVACALYFIAFHHELLVLLAFSTGYTDLTSDDPLRQYVWQRPELWALVGLAALGVRRASWGTGAVTVGGSVVIAGFQALSRADFDFWKHSIYLIFFLAPLAGPTLLSGVQRLLIEPARQADGGYGRRRAATTVLSALVIGLAGLILTLEEASRLVTFYPNLNPSLPEIRRQTATASTVLTDDSALRYYLYPRLDTGRVTDSFFIDYRGQHGLDGYRAAIRDRSFDVIVLDGGIGPLGRQIRDQLGWLVQRYYQPVSTTADRTGAMVQVYRPRRDDIVSYVGAGDHVIAVTDTYRRWEGEVAPPSDTAPDGRTTYSFDAGPRGWGGQPEHEELQPGVRVAATRDQTWDGRPTLQFTMTDEVTTVAVRGTGWVSRVRAQVFVDPAGADPEVPIGMFGFDGDWRWHDDGFRQVVPAGRWIEIAWQIAEPGIFHEIGLKLPAGAKTVYVGQVELEP
jgi:hypothetical protein